MKASELIEELKDLLEYVGDLNVEVRNSDGDYLDVWTTSERINTNGIKVIRIN